VNLGVLLALIWVHVIADFIFQTDKMALGKSTSDVILTGHVAVYTAFMVPFGPGFAVVNFFLHWITDYVSSRLTSRLYKAGKRHEFFIVIGIDQALHLTALVLTYHLFGGWGGLFHG